MRFDVRSFACLGAAVSAALVLALFPPLGSRTHAAAPPIADRPAADRPAAGAALVPHKATYRLSLLRTAPGEGVRAVSGSMVYELADRCDGYTIESNVAMRMVSPDGESRDVGQRYAAWESKDGRYSSFTMQALEDGESVKAYRGEIALNADGSGTAVYEGEKATDFTLAPGTMLSTAHTVALIESARAGKTFFSGHVIDGSFEQGPFIVTAAIARARDSKAAVDKAGARELSGGRYWPVSLAYFPLSSRDSMPDYELVMELLPAGVSRGMTQNFGSFTLGFTLVDVEPLAAPDC